MNMEISEDTKRPIDEEKMHLDDDTTDTMNKIFSTLPGKEDVTLKIFSRLPVRDICRYKCLSKEFLNLTSNPLFTYYHSESLLSMTPATGFFVQRSPSDSDSLWWPYASLSGFDYKEKFRFDLLDTYSDDFPGFDFEGDDIVEVIDSCKGLLLCTTSDPSNLTVCNPLTGQQLQIPHLHRKRNWQVYYALFSELSLTGCRFKVICIYMRSNCTLSRLSIFSSETGRWEDIGDQLPPLSPDFMNKPRVCFNDAFFWDCFEGNILVLRNRCSIELIEAPNAPFGRSMWVHNGKLLCYSHGFNTDRGSRVRQLVSSTKSGKFEWKIFSSPELDSLEEDVHKGYWEFRGNNTSTRKTETAPPGITYFTVTSYDHRIKSLFLYVSNAIFLYNIAERRLEYQCGSPTDKFELVNRALPYVHSLSSIQVWQDSGDILDKQNGKTTNVVILLKEKCDTEEDLEEMATPSNVIETHFSNSFELLDGMSEENGRISR